MRRQYYFVTITRTSFLNSTDEFNTVIDEHPAAWLMKNGKDRYNSYTIRQWDRISAGVALNYLKAHPSPLS